jgi:hypothetical protein
VSRGRIKTNYRRIIHGDDQDLEAALDAAGGVLTSESIKIRKSLVVLDLAVTQLGINGFVVEDLPSIILNTAVILLEMKRGTKADESLFASFFALMFSCIMAVRTPAPNMIRRIPLTIAHRGGKAGCAPSGGICGRRRWTSRPWSAKSRTSSLFTRARAGSRP